jgi:hypothetical protein
MDQPARPSSPAQRLPFALWVFCVVLGLPTVNAPNWATRQDTLFERAGLILAALAFMAVALRRGVGWVLLRLTKQPD